MEQAAEQSDALSKSDVSKFVDKASTIRKPLMDKESFGQQLKFWGGLVLFFLSLTLIVYLVYAFFVFDWEASKAGFFQTVLSTDPDHVGDAIGGYIELLAAILGIMITVVAIVLQLAAQNYGTRLNDLFLSDNVVRAYFSLLVCSLLYAILIVFAIKKDFFPHYAIQILLSLTLLEIALLAPFFLFVFKFLTPTNLLSSIQITNKQSIQAATERRNFPYLKKFQNEVANSMEQVTDTALSAITQMDRNLGLMAINQIREMVLDYIDHKQKLPRLWFLVPKDYFIQVSSEFYQEICENRLWLEAKAFMDMDLIFKNGMETMPDAISAIAHNTRILGEAAIKTKDDELLQMAIRFYNTYIRVGINAGNQRFIFNLFYQYRLLTESVFEYDTELSVRILNNFKYYGEQCYGRGMPLAFVMFSTAFDLGGLVATAYDKKLENIKELLLIFLALEDQVNKQKDPFVYSGIRNAQLILATYLFSQGDRELLPMIIDDLKSETISQLTRWRDGLLAIKERRYIEVTDRGYEFMYIDDTQKKNLVQFYDEYILSQPEVFKQE
ncbi:MAG: DUF2254 domain-containing protein [Proteobacteria bacterium]|nr:DUF2254 domain-containing protein [Pseudomonadota bacterium]